MNINIQSSLLMIFCLLVILLSFYYLDSNSNIIILIGVLIILLINHLIKNTEFFSLQNRQDLLNDKINLLSSLLKTSETSSRNSIDPVTFPSIQINTTERPSSQA
jgi:hypothetical protein